MQAHAQKYDYQEIYVELLKENSSAESALCLGENFDTSKIKEYLRILNSRERELTFFDMQWDTEVAKSLILLKKYREFEQFFEYWEKVIETVEDDIIDCVESDESPVDRDERQRAISLYANELYLRGLYSKMLFLETKDQEKLKESIRHFKKCLLNHRGSVVYRNCMIHYILLLDKMNKNTIAHREALRQFEQFNARNKAHAYYTLKNYRKAALNFEKSKQMEPYDFSMLKKSYQEIINELNIEKGKTKKESEIQRIQKEISRFKMKLEYISNTHGLR